MDEYPRTLQNTIVGNCSTLLDIGCGACSPLREVASQMEYSVGVDAFGPALEASRENKVHSEHVLMEVSELSQRFEADSFDCVAATDLIEHLSKEDGLKLLADMERIACRKVVIFTPNGFLPQQAYDGNDYQVHLSGWSVSEMRERGYRVIGMNGWKPLRGERALLRWWPRLFWEPISFLTQSLVTNRTERAFQILCVKDL